MRIATKLLRIGAACSAIGAPYAVLAQSSDAPSTAGSSTSNQELKLEEIIVTAQKREQRLQDVPITVSAVTAQTAEKMGITATEDLGNAVPGLMFKKSSAYAAPFIRGVGSVVVAQGDESSVATYVDGVLQVSPSSAMFSLNNIERIEVLKGPQGTLFGRNATGGVINVITRTPSHDSSIDASVGYGNFETVDGRLYATTGLSENVAIDAAVYGKDQGEGWGKNEFLDKEVNKVKEIAFRTKLLYTPSDSTTLTLAAAYTDSTDDRSGSFRLAPGEVSFVGGFTSPGFYNTDSNLPSVENKLDRYDFSATVDHDMDWASIKSISSYSKQHFTWNYDVDATPIPLTNAFIDPHDKNFTQELQLLSPKGERVEWIAGVYYLNSDADFGNAHVDGVGLGPLLFQDVRATQKTESIAGFGQATIELVSKLRLTLGARYTSDQRKLVGGINTGLGDGEVRHDQKTFNKFTYRVALDYKLTDDILAYASLATGFKAGLYNTTSPYQDVIDPETLKAYEVGLKTQLWDERLQLNTAYFHYNYKNLQTNRVDQFSLITVNSGVAHLDGVDMDLSFVPLRGLTLQGGVSYLDAKFHDFPDAIYFDPLPTGGYDSSQTRSATGNRLVRSPKWTFLVGGQYKLETNAGSWVLATSYNRTSRFYWDIQNDHDEPPANMLNSTLTWTLPNDHYEISVWGKNLLDDNIHTYVAPVQLGYIAMPSAPRTYGGTFRVRF